MDTETVPILTAGVATSETPTLPVTRVFLSHSSADKPFARRLTGDLQRHGVEVWIDEAGLLPGAEWLQQLNAAVASVDYVLVVISPAAVRARWVRHELRVAKDRGVRIVPLMYLPTELPPALARLQVVDLSGRAAYRRGLERLLVLFAQSWAIPRHLAKPWTKRGVALAKRGGIVEVVDGRIEFTRRVAERLRVDAGRWLRGLPPYGGSKALADWREYSGVAMLHSFAPDARLTADEEVRVAVEAHDHLLHFLLDVAVRGRVMTEVAEVLSVDSELGEEMSAQIPHVIDLGFVDDTADLRAAATIMFVELVRARLLDSVPQMASFAEAIGTVIHSMFGFWTGPEMEQPEAETASARPAAKARRRSPTTRSSTRDAPSTH